MKTKEELLKDKKRIENELKDFTLPYYHTQYKIKALKEINKQLKEYD